MHSPFLSSQSGSPQGKPVVSARVPTVQPLPRDEWPAWTILICLARRDYHKGLGDTVKHLFGDERSDKFQKWFHDKFGKSCGCTNRQQWLNERFPYPDFNASQTENNDDTTDTMKI